MPETSLEASTKATIAQPDDHTLAIPRADAPQTSPDATLPAADGNSLGHYRLIKPLGKGGMGQVYLAEDTRLRRPVAIKVMHPQFAANAEARERFLREARAAAAVRHHNVITIYEVNEVASTPFIVMEFLRGASLDAYLDKKGPPTFEQILRVAREMAAGLGAAHDQGLVHRDVKPANVWLEVPRGHVKLLDFGLARLDREDSALTGLGEVMGTPAYMAPEQARGERVDQRADLYSLGAVLYALCTGRPPFTGSTVMAVLTALAVDRATPVRSLNPAIPASLAELIERLLSKRPEQRPASARDVLLALRNVERAPDAKDEDAAMSVTPMNVEADSAPTVRAEEKTDVEPTRRIPERPKRRRRRKSRNEPNWQRRIGWLIGGLTLIVACIIGIDIATRSSRDTEPGKNSAVERPIPATVTRLPESTKANAQEPVPQPDEPIENVQSNPQPFFPPPPPPKKDFLPPFPPPPKKGF